jgi:2-succinyl-6-hydroxy-2,4-cyclohexadiene-1-carboxylate synthase
VIELCAIHGFLGRPLDWSELFSDFHAADLFSRKFLGDSPSLDSAAKRINSSTKRRPRVLLGYSLGGRIGMHALTSQPKSWDAAVIISAHPGLAEADLAGREARIKQDEDWARRFESDDWGTVLRDWNAQPVFSGVASPIKRDASDRTLLAQALRAWSLGRQADLRPALKSLKIPVLFMAGERDSKFTALASECAALSSSFRSVIVPGAGHRVPWEKPSQFLNELTKFLEEVGLSRLGEHYAN